MTLEKIAVFSAKSYDEQFFKEASLHLPFAITYFEQSLEKDTASLAKGFKVICIFPQDVADAQVCEILANQGVQLIALRCKGYDDVDLQSTRKFNLKVVRVPDYSPYSVAEHAVALLLCLNRKVHHAYIRTHSYNFNIEDLIGFDLHGKVAGVIGVGEIGKAIIQILRGFGMKVLAYDIDENQVKNTEAEFVGLETLYRESDVITLHCPLSAQNTHMINQEALGKMKRNVILINTARGALIHSGDLIKAIKEKKIGAVGLDVYENEKKYFYRDLSLSLIEDDLLARLQSFPNVLITSHQAYFTQEALSSIARTTLQNIRDFFDGKPLKHEVLLPS